jgi:hypothetical protein
LDLNYKNFTFNFVFQGNSGKYVKFGGPFLNEFNQDDYKVQSTMLDYWTPSSNTFIDPETTSFGNDLSGNYGEYSSNPTSRNFGINLNVKF